jgi:hypothetical protein
MTRAPGCPWWPPPGPAARSGARGCPGTPTHRGLGCDHREVTDGVGLVAVVLTLAGGNPATERTPLAVVVRQLAYPSTCPYLVG